MPLKRCARRFPVRFCKCADNIQQSRVFNLPPPPTRLHLSTCCQITSIHLLEGFRVFNTRAQPPCFPQISSGSFISLQSRRDLSRLLCSLFNHAICFPPFSSSYFIPSPLHIIPSPPCPHPLPLTLSHPPLRSHPSDSSFLFFFFSFFSTATPHTTLSCCSESLKGAEQGGALGCGLKSFRDQKPRPSCII